LIRIVILYRYVRILATVVLYIAVGNLNLYPCMVKILFNNFQILNIFISLYQIFSLKFPYLALNSNLILDYSWKAQM